MNNYYVYEFIRLDTNEPFYIGMGHKNRWRDLKKRNEYFKKIVNKHSVVVNILHDNLDRQTAFGLEVYYIWLYRDVIGYEMCNFNDGGEGCVLVGKNNPNYGKDMSGENNPMWRKHHSKEAKKRMGEVRIEKGLSKGENNPMYGVHRYGESNPMYGKNPWDYMTEEKKEETRKKISEMTKEKNNPRAKSVICLTTKRIFFTAKEGAKYYNCNHGNICNCCRGYCIRKEKKEKVNSAGKLSDGTKLVWRYLNWKHNKKYRIKTK